MHRALSARWLNRALSIGEGPASARLPLYLCPAASASARWTTSRSSLAASTPRATTAICSRRLNHTDAAPSERPEPAKGATRDAATEATETPEPVKNKLPLNCSGCGAYTQTKDPNQLGYFTLDSRRVCKWLGLEPPRPLRNATKHDGVVNEALAGLDPKLLKELGLDPGNLVRGQVYSKDAEAAAAHIPEPICDRCFDLKHYNVSKHTSKIPVYHPTAESLRETIDESPHKYNHVYHVLDAADFPMSLIPRLNVLLGDIPMRGRNRRSRVTKYVKDRNTELSFVITRSDLLAPQKAMVDAMLPYLREVLREALGRLGNRIRLGNIRLVSAKRKWWTTQLKEEVWKRGGAGWLVGKVNVGKSELFEAIYPKNRMHKTRDVKNGKVNVYGRNNEETNPLVWKMDEGSEPGWEDKVGDLLPKLPPARPYPQMPLVSSLAGTTATPIRVPFGNYKGELIDLPGMSRGNLDVYVKEKDRQSMVLTKRIVPEQFNIMPGQSLILGGGLVRITPRTPDVVVLAYNFTALPAHLTATFKAMQFQEQSRVVGDVPSILAEGAGESMKHAERVHLNYDVTNQRSGPLTNKHAVGMTTDQLHYRVLSRDVLIEGVGYVELVAQVRKRRQFGSRGPQYVAPEPEFDSFESLFEGRRGAEDVKGKKVVRTVKAEVQEVKEVKETQTETTKLQESETNEVKETDTETTEVQETETNEVQQSETDEAQDATSMEEQWSKARSLSSEGPEAQWSKDRPAPTPLSEEAEERRKKDFEDRDRAQREGMELDALEPAGVRGMWPTVDIFTPEGRFIGVRPPINGFLNNKRRVLAKHKRARPRKSMKGQKKLAKRRRRELEAAALLKRE